jgi:hypothetical protein
MTQNPATKPDPLDGMFSAAELSTEYIPPIEYVVQNLIPEGLTLLVSPPKIGKSWMVLDIAAAVSEGGYALGVVPVDKRPVLYLALEDGRGRLQRRQEKIDAPASQWLNYLTLPDLNTSVIETITAFVERQAEHKPLVILDTLGKVRGTYTGNDSYGRDYSDMSALKSIVDHHPGSSLIVVHHTNKGEKADFMDSVSGTQGLNGGADSTLVINRKRHEREGTLHVTSRDAAEGEYACFFDDGLWTLDGADLADAAKAAQTRKATAGLGDAMGEVIALVSKHPEGIKPKDVAELLGWEASKARLYLKRAYDENRLAKAGYGVYTPVTHVTPVTLPGTSPTNSYTVTEVTHSQQHECPLHGTEYDQVCFTCIEITKQAS